MAVLILVELLVLVLHQVVAVTVVLVLERKHAVLQTPEVAVAVAAARGMEALAAPVTSSSSIINPR